MRQILLLRGINLGPRNRISMPDLRVALKRAGLGEARTYLQSGNVVVSRDAPAEELGSVVGQCLNARGAGDLEPEAGSCGFEAFGVAAPDR